MFRSSPTFSAYATKVKEDHEREEVRVKRDHGYARRKGRTRALEREPGRFIERQKFRRCD